MKQICNEVKIIGGGLAGAEAAWQLARRGLSVRLIEMKPIRYSPAHQSPDFGELVCSMAFIIGFLYRLAMIPMIFTMAIAFFVIHANDIFTVKELAFIYLVVFILMYIAGPGKYSIDHIIGNELQRRKSK